MESPLARVRTIVVSGNATVPSQRILSDAGIGKGLSLWQVSPARIRRAVVAKEPVVDTVQVDVDYWHGKVALAVRERPVVAVYESGGRFYRLLADGVVYGELDAAEGFRWPVVSADPVASPEVGAGAMDRVQSGKPPANPYVPAVCRQLQEIPMSILQDVSEIHLDRFGIASLYLGNHFVVQCRVEDLSNRIRDAQSAIQYFSGRGYPPGVIDMTGVPPYRYAPLGNSAAGPAPPKEGTR